MFHTFTSAAILVLIITAAQADPTTVQFGDLDLDETERPGPIDLSREPDFGLGTLEVHPSIRELIRDGEHEILEPKAMQVLVALHQAGSRVMSRDDLIARCWDGRIVGEDAINRVIWRLRRLSEADGGANFVIETIPKVGYRLQLPGGREASTAARPPITADEPSPPAVRGDDAPLEPHSEDIECPLMAQSGHGCF
jgi:DNA-binding winged helix-turn-helix (wHTH) protein